jgi:hypothetical protein
VTADHDRDDGAAHLAAMEAKAALYEEYLCHHPERQRGRDELCHLGLDPDRATAEA